MLGGDEMKTHIKSQSSISTSAIVYLARAQSKPINQIKPNIFSPIFYQKFIQDLSSYRIGENTGIHLYLPSCKKLEPSGRFFHAKQEADLLRINEVNDNHHRYSGFYKLLRSLLGVTQESFYVTPYKNFLRKQNGLPVVYWDEFARVIKEVTRYWELQLLTFDWNYYDIYEVERDLQLSEYIKGYWKMVINRN